MIRQILMYTYFHGLLFSRHIDRYDDGFEIINLNVSYCSSSDHMFGTYIFLNVDLFLNNCRVTPFCQILTP